MSLLSITSIEEMQSISRQWRRAGESIAFVPTMGNLHDGHLQLVETARQHGKRVVVSIFVNPLQFGPNEDFGKYPRTLAEDKEKLDGLEVDAVFCPDEKTFYQKPRDRTTFVEVPVLSDMLCGASRLGHFRGVTTVVNKLFNIVQPDVAVFGSKDYQQLAIIRQMVLDLAMPIQIIAVETVREADGLAMSSRNKYLSAEQRALAPQLYKSLQKVQAQLESGHRDLVSLRDSAKKELVKTGFRLDYLEIRDATSLALPTTATQRRVILTAVWLGNTRLIDNIVV